MAIRPLHALALIGMALSGWAGWRAALVTRDFGLAAAPADPAPRAAALLAPPPGSSDAFAWSDPRGAEPGAVAPAAPAAAPPVQIVYIPQPVPMWSTAPPVRAAAPPARGDLPARGDRIVWYGAPPPAGEPSAQLGMAAAAPTAIPAQAAPATPKPPGTPPEQQAQAYDRAANAYARLAAGDRKGAAMEFRAALATAPEHPNAAGWGAEYRALTRHWRAEVYALTRPAGDNVLPAGSPVLGTDQTQVTVGYAPRPTARRPVELFARLLATDPRAQTVAGPAAQAGVGLSWRPLPGVPLTLFAERLIRVSGAARDDFALRAAGGYGGRWHGFELSAYGEGGIVGQRPDWFVGGQAEALRGLNLPLPANTRLLLGGGVWGGAQQSGITISRVDIGPTIKLRQGRRVPVSLSADYRWRVEGNALPGNGPVVTLAGHF
ncbi:MAG: hypothetical protein RQ833_02705 [Sphingomonadaceae bacterium]|nr:hypothetical protein [Sphingomonadaceae bacterium]